MSTLTPRSSTYCTLLLYTHTYMAVRGPTAGVHKYGVLSIRKRICSALPCSYLFQSKSVVLFVFVFDDSRARTSHSHTASARHHTAYTDTASPLGLLTPLRAHRRGGHTRTTQRGDDTRWCASACVRGTQLAPRTHVRLQFAALPFAALCV